MGISFVIQITLSQNTHEKDLYGICNDAFDTFANRRYVKFSSISFIPQDLRYRNISVEKISLNFPDYSHACGHKKLLLRLTAYPVLSPFDLENYNFLLLLLPQYKNDTLRDTSFTLQFIAISQTYLEALPNSFSTSIIYRLSSKFPRMLPCVT